MLPLADEILIALDAAYQLRHGPRAGRVSWNPGQLLGCYLTDSERKRVQRALESLVGEGLVDPFYGRSLTRVTVVKLTDTGRARVAALRAAEATT